MHLCSLLPKPKRGVTDSTDGSDGLDLNGERGRLRGEQRTTTEETTQLMVAHNEGSLTVLDKYEVIARMGHAPDRLVQMHPSDMQPRTFVEEELARPSPAQVAEETEATRRALEVIIMEKTAKTQPKNVTASVARSTPSELIRYTPKETAASGGEPPQARIIKMTQAPVDPLEPPRFHHKRIPRAPPSPPAPRLHSPPRRVTAEEQRAWHIPPCISSWKNPKGYTVPLDKRLASDGRALQERTINSRMSDLAEALFLAEKHNREEVELRRDVQRKLAEAEARQKDEKLRRMAEEAREERRRLNEAIRREEERERRLRERDDRRYREPVSSRFTEDDGHDPHHRLLSLSERERLRKERDYEREREYRLSRMPAEQRARVLEREADRDIGERIALGMAQGPTTGAVGEHDLFDERLFDRGGGLGTGFGAGDDETYTVYDRPLRDDKAIHMIYQPRIRTNGATDDYGGVDGEMADEEGRSDGRGAAKERGLKVARPDKAFSGASGGLTIEGGAREGPVQFERHSQNRVIGDDHHGPAGSGSRRADDPFGLDQFLSAAKKGRKEEK